LINEIMSAWCASRTQEEAIAELQRARIACAPVCQLSDVLNDPQVRARQLLGETAFPGTAQPIPLSTPAVRLSETPGDVRRRAPVLGEHTTEVLAELGFSSEEIATFRAERVV
jgi:crotonobetainyl-CoA:carnitine CoA-transferase CaiB-like acyl-CoA transferase